MTRGTTTADSRAAALSAVPQATPLIPPDTKNAGCAPTTIAEENGRDWETIQTRLNDEKAAGDNAIGAALMRSFPGIGK